MSEILEEIQVRCSSGSGNRIDLKLFADGVVSCRYFVAKTVKFCTSTCYARHLNPALKFFEKQISEFERNNNFIEEHLATPLFECHFAGDRLYIPYHDTVAEDDPLYIYMTKFSAGAIRYFLREAVALQDVGLHIYAVESPVFGL